MPVYNALYSLTRFCAIGFVLTLTIGRDYCESLHLPRIELPHNKYLQSDASSSGTILPACDRRSILTKTLLPTTASLLLIQLHQPLLNANAAIDVTGLRQADSRSDNSIIMNQIRSYDGSEMTRVQEIKKLKAESTTAASNSSTGQKESLVARTTSNDPIADVGDEVGIATYAYRYSTAFQPRMTKVGNYGEKLRYDDQLVTSTTGKGYISVSFEFPSDWLQLDKILGGIQYVDQRNGDKLYILKAKLPSDRNLVSVPKQFFGDAIFHPRGTILRSGITVDEYKVKTSTILSDGAVAIPHRRLLIKYATVTPNGLRTERRAIVDAYEVDEVAYMMVTSSNAVKFDANGRERETVEAIADSFRLEKIA